MVAASHVLEPLPGHRIPCSKASLMQWTQKLSQTAEQRRPVRCLDGWCEWLIGVVCLSAQLMWSSPRLSSQEWANKEKFRRIICLVRMCTHLRKGKGGGLRYEIDYSLLWWILCLFHLVCSQGNEWRQKPQRWANVSDTWHVSSNVFCMVMSLYGTVKLQTHYIIIVLHK